MATVTQNSVFSAAEALEVRGDKVSVRAVRDYLGGGSPNAVAPLLAAWRAKRPVVAAAEIQLDPRIGQLIAEQVKVAAGESAKRADERASEAEDTLSLCQQEAEELGEQLQAALKSLDESRAKGEQQAGTIGELREEIERIRKDAEEEVEEAQARADRERESAEAARTALAKAELRLEALPRLEREIEQLRVALAEAQTGRQQAEQQAAVLVAQEASQRERAEDFSKRLQSAEKRALEADAEAKAAARESSAARTAEESSKVRLEAAGRELEVVKDALGGVRDELKELRAAAKKPAKKSEE